MEVELATLRARVVELEEDCDIIVAWLDRWADTEDIHSGAQSLPTTLRAIARYIEQRQTEGSSSGTHERQMSDG